jgi:hypothetical protein
MSEGYLTEKNSTYLDPSPTAVWIYIMSDKLDGKTIRYLA